LVLFVLALSTSKMLFSFSGSYLIATQAAKNNDFSKAARSYNQLIQLGEKDSKLIKDALIFSVVSSNLEEAILIATHLDTVEQKEPAAGFYFWLTQ
jgi:hypothetical protein